MMTNEVHVERESPFACVMDAIEPSKRQQHIATAKFVFAAVNEVRELPNGYAFQLPHASEMPRKVGDFIALEQLVARSSASRWRWSGRVERYGYS
jgi:hypothetical protein